MLRIRLITENTLTAFAIRWWTWSKWSHVEFVLPEGYLGARPDGVKLRPHCYCKPTKELLGTIQCDEQTASKIIAYAKNQIGYGYDFLSILGFVIHKKLVEKNKVICSRYVDECCAAFKVELLDNVPPNQISPRDIAMSTKIVWDE